MQASFLIVDDDPDICDYMELLLTQKGYRVKTLLDSTKAEEELRRDDYHILILDLMMPKLNGIELLEKVRKFDTDLSVIIFTGYPSVDTAVQSIKLGVDDYIRKPFELDEFNQTVEKILKKKGLLLNPEKQLLLTIGKRIRGARRNEQLTLKQMARRTGLSVSLLSQIERAETSASVLSLYKIATALNTRLTQLFGPY